MGGGAWPFLARGAICLVNSDNERDSNLLTRVRIRNRQWRRSRPFPDFPVVLHGFGRRGLRLCRWFGSVVGACADFFLAGSAARSRTKRSNNRSVMPLDVPGCTRATLMESVRSPAREGRVIVETRSPSGPGAAIVPRERGIPRSADSSEVGANKSLPFVHTARRYYRLNDRARSSDRSSRCFRLAVMHPSAGKIAELDRLEEVKVVTRYP